MGYSIWLEFEHYVDTPPEANEDYCNVIVIYDNGRRQGYNVWTIEYFRNNIQSILDEAEEEGFTTLPDIIVSRLEREHITEVLKQIVVEPE